MHNLSVDSTLDPGDERRYSHVDIGETLSTATSTNERCKTKLGTVTGLNKRAARISVACSTSGTDYGADLRLGYQRAPAGYACGVCNGVSGQMLEIVGKTACGASPAPTNKDSCYRTSVSGIQGSLLDQVSHAEVCWHSDDSNVIGNGGWVVVGVDEEPGSSTASTSSVQGVGSGNSDGISDSTAVM